MEVNSNLNSTSIQQFNGAVNSKESEHHENVENINNNADNQNSDTVTISDDAIALSGNGGGNEPPIKG
tara:strand:- start:78 stop:281 length:204 start_codon:yes stop_codon:yes gene_type:complete